MKHICLKGETGRLISGVIRNFAVTLPENNPGMFSVFRCRDIAPAREITPWAGEYAGKYLSSCAQLYRLTEDRELYDAAVAAARELVSCQDEDGYLGTASQSYRLTQIYPPAMDYYVCVRDKIDYIPREHPETPLWDIWANYHNSISLATWYEITGETLFLEAAEKTACLIRSEFYDSDKPLLSAGGHAVVFPIYHTFAALYRITGKQTYLESARMVEAEFKNLSDRNWIDHALKGGEFYQSFATRWEGLYFFLGIGDLYLATGEEWYLTVLRNTCDSILRTDIHNTGAFSSGESAEGKPKKETVIETCCVVAFNACVCKLIECELASGKADSKKLAHYADFLERSLLNAVEGSFSKSGSWSTYNTPTEGLKRASYQENAGQGKAGAPDLNCCSVNAPRGLGDLCEWAYPETEEVLYINWYGDCTVNGADWKLDVSGGYPYQSAVRIAFSGKKKLYLRIPANFAVTSAKINGAKIDMSGISSYLVVDADGSADISLTFDFSLRAVIGSDDFAGKLSVYRGPLLLAFDAEMNPSVRITDLHVSDPAKLEGASAEASEGSVSVVLKDGTVLCDFAAAGRTGALYKSWL